MNLEKFYLKTIEGNINNFKRIFNHYFRDHKESISFINNDDWLSELKNKDLILRWKYGHKRETKSVKERLKEPYTLSFVEFNYMILQAYFFYHLNKNNNCCLQMGGSDQWGNIVTGIEKISKISKKHKYVTYNSTQLFLLVKNVITEQGAVWIDKEKFNSFEFYQYWRNVDDKDVEKLIKYYEDLNKEEIKSLIKDDINNAKKKLAFIVTADCHSEEDAMVTEKKAIEIFENKNFDQDIDIIKIDNQGSRKITDILTSQQLITSKSEVKRMIENNGIKLNDISIIDINILNYYFMSMVLY